ncbi:TonB-dependent siderophore receptor [Synoicihabitans lomoniglobus]|uniref:TonB-dependent receptor n=1 Tax=Synoicihabitans lomoniglobus TaxID=2909285 RepID=A0AAF0CMR5_9BACT|nr:TonB-dependent receptor [Opitutaceae bacterium LMO-M01]WED63681.1 TonB-dependent receptor [Opitutaceae bacterium LMO-M01]
MKNRIKLGVLSMALIGGHFSLAQTITETSASSDDKVSGDVIQMSPFVTSSGDDEGYQAQQTVVGSRSAKNLVDLPASVSIINLQQIDDLGATSVHDVLRYGVSGVTQNQSFNDDVNIRGFRAGTPLRNGATRNATNKGAPLFDIERVEVLKGPGAMLNGSNGGIGGSVNYVTRKPTATRAGEVQLSLSDQGAVRVESNVTGPLYSSDDLDVNYRVTLGLLDSDEPRGKAMEWEDQKFYGGALAFYAKNGSSLTINGYYWENNDYLYLLDFLDITVPADPVTGLIPAVFNQYSTPDFAPGRTEDAFWPIKSSTIDVTYLTKLTENSDLRAAYYYAHHDDRRENNRGITVQADNYTLNRQDVRNNNTSNSHSYQIDYLHQFEADWVKIDSTLGVDGSVDDGLFYQNVLSMPTLDTRNPDYTADAAWFAQFPNDDAYFVELPAGVTGSPTRRKSHTTNLSYYFQENVSFLQDRLILVGGLRWFETDGYTDNFVTGETTHSDPTKFRVHKYGVVYKILPGLSIYATDAQNVFPAAAGNTDRYIQSDGLGEPYKDSLGKLREIGVKFNHQVSDNLSVYGSVVAFEMEQTNIRTFGILPDSGNMGLIQSAKDSADGWETDLGFQFKTDGGRADIILTYFNGDSAVADDEGKAYVRQTNAFVPEKFSVLAKYSWTGGPLKGLRAGFGIEEESSKRYGAYFLDRPLLADGFVGYEFTENWDAQLNLNNLTDERYILQTAANGLVQASDTFRAKLTVSYRW